MATETNIKERKVIKAALRVLKIDTLQIDPSYQRELKKGYKKIRDNFDL